MKKLLLLLSLVLIISINTEAKGVHAMKAGCKTSIMKPNKPNKPVRAHKAKVVHKAHKIIRKK